MRKFLKETLFLSSVVFLSLIFALDLKAQMGHQQCSSLFVTSANEKPQYLVFTERMKIVTIRLSQALEETYGGLGRCRSNNERNQVLQRIIYLNNEALNLYDQIVSSRSVFNSLAEKMFQSSLLEAVAALLSRQGLSKTQVKAILNSREKLIAELDNLARQHPGPMGFIQKSDDVILEPTPRTMGFRQNNLESEPYGANRKNKDEAPSPEHRKQNPIGFIVPKSNPESQTQPMKSIGFIQSAEPIDAAYTIAIHFDFKNATFIAVSNQSPIGFGAAGP